MGGTEEEVDENGGGLDWEVEGAAVGFEGVVAQKEHSNIVTGELGGREGHSVFLFEHTWNCQRRS